MTRLSRRSFVLLGSVGLAAIAIPTRARPRARYPIGFSTLGCPAWPWGRVLAEADRLGYVGIELRGLEGEMDLTKRAEFTGHGLRKSRRDLEALDLRVACLGSSAEMHLADPGARSAALDEARRFIDLAHALGARCVRVFGDRLPPDEPREAVIDRVADGFRILAAHALPARVVVVQETHGDFVRAADVAEVARRVDSPAFGVLWDIHHPFARAAESPATSVAALGPLIRHTHFKDSVPAGTDRRYVLTGKGDVPLREAVQLLSSSGYVGLYGFEWEKRWHPELEEPEVAFPHFANVVSGYLAGAGVRPV